uniref:Immunogenic protein ts11 n=1 Tax=Echinococcus granulosus TaxID=6210 RepID=A0A068WTL3_ECHGR|nr:immunogenic protein ts11 [Echinococcus granulosus]
MLRVAAALHLAVLIVAASFENEPLMQRFQYLLGGVVPLTPEALQSEEVKERVQSALEQLSIQSGSHLAHRIIHIRSGTRQLKWRARQRMRRWMRRTCPRSTRWRSTSQPPEAPKNDTPLRRFPRMRRKSLSLFLFVYFHFSVRMLHRLRERMIPVQRPISFL